MELMVAIGILVMIILAVGVIFAGASQSVGMSQAVMEEMSSVRATQQFIERELKGLNKDGFLVIRSRLLSADPALKDITYHFDQLSFLATGSFQNRSGTDSATPFTDSTTSSAAHIWIGHLIVEKNGAPPSYVTPDQRAVYPQSQLPTGVVNNSGTLTITNESDFIIGHHITLLLPGPADAQNHVMTAGQNVMAYPTIDGTSPVRIAGNSAEGTAYPAHITSSRYSIVAQTPSQVMQYAIQARLMGINNPEADLFTYRFRTLASVLDTEVAQNPFVNAYFRSTSNVMAGVSSFRVDWTDGSVTAGELNWYGAANPRGLPGTETLGPTPNGDTYVATFSYYNKPLWPKALRITMHVASARIGGRDFVQVVNLP